MKEIYKKIEEVIKGDVIEDFALVYADYIDSKSKYREYFEFNINDVVYNLIKRYNITCDGELLEVKEHTYYPEHVMYLGITHTSSEGGTYFLPVVLTTEKYIPEFDVRDIAEVLERVFEKHHKAVYSFVRKNISSFYQYLVKYELEDDDGILSELKYSKYMFSEYFRDWLSTTFDNKLEELLLDLKVGEIDDILTNLSAKLFIDVCENVKEKLKDDYTCIEFLEKNNQIKVKGVLK